MRAKILTISLILLNSWLVKSQSKNQSVIFEKQDNILKINYFQNKDLPTLKACVYFNVGKPSTQLIEVQMKKSASQWFCDLPMFPNTLSFLVVFKDSLQIIDNNAGEGYWDIIKESKKPLRGALAGIADMYAGYRYNVIGVDNRNDLALTLYQQEFSLYPELKRKHYLYYLFALKKTQHKDFGAELAAFINLRDLEEQELRFAMRAFQELQNPTMSKLLNDLLFERFPEHPNILDQKSLNLRKAFALTKSFKEKQSIYKDFVTTFCSVKDSSGRSRMKHYQAQMLANLCKYFIEKNEFEEWIAEVNQLKDNSLKIDAYWLGAVDLLEKEAYLDKAEWIAENAVLWGDTILNQPRTALESSDISEISVLKYRKRYLAYHLDTYGMILAKNGKKNQACIVLQKAAIEYGERNIPMINQNYIALLGQVGQKKLAETEALLFQQKGQSTPQIDKVFLDNIPINTQNEPKKQNNVILSQENTPSFVLTDSKGQKISQDSLLGRVVVLDFWATWCGSCISGFEGMYNLMNKFKENNQVIFLFVNTLEFGENIQQKALSIIQKRGYDMFKVLFDDKNIMATTFKVNALPTKIIIDKNGYLRFRQVGSGFTDEMLQFEDIITQLLIDSSPLQRNPK